MNKLGQVSLLIGISMLMAVLSVLALGHSQTNVPVLGIAMLALWLLPAKTVSSWLLWLGLSGFLWGLPEQPLALSIGLLMLFPLLNVAFSSKGTWQVGILLLSIVGAMNVGLMALQGEGKLSGSASFTLIQIASVVLIWIAARSWRPIASELPWVFGVLLVLCVMGEAIFALFSLSIIAMVMALQHISKTEYFDWIGRLSWILPSMAFACVAVVPYFSVDSSIFVSWLLVLGGGLLGEFLLDDSTEEEIH
jgi:hypothetical protein